MTQFQSANPIAWRHFPAGEHGFYRAPVLITGPTEAVLIDGGFTYSDGRSVADAIKASGKRLMLIYISQSDPDYYFSLDPIRAAFPNARIIAAPATIAAIRATVEKKLAVWGPQLQDNGPRILADVVIPEPHDAKTLSVNGETIEIIDADGLPNRRYLWIPSLRAVVGGVLLFSGVHVWTADTNSPVLRAAWRANLDVIARLNPAVVVPGHMASTAVADTSAITHTMSWLLAFEEELAKAANGAALAAAMMQRFPGLGMEVAIDIGAKVATGEMKWG